MDLPGLSSARPVRSRRRLFLLGTAAALGFASLTSGAGEGIDGALRSARDTLRAHDASGQVHLVEIDRRSLSAIDQWPWPRSVHARVIDTLREAGVRSIAFDVEFSAVSQSGEDAALAAALDRAGHSVVLPAIRQAASAGSSDYIDTDVAKPFEGKAFLAAVNVLPDPDGYVRRMLLGVEIKGVPRPSLASMVAEAQAEIGRDFAIDYSIRPDSLPRHSVVDLIEGRVAASELAGKRVIIGATAVEMGDRYAVPRHGVIPGVMIQALAAETLLAGAVPSTASGLWPLLFALGGLGIAAQLRRRSPRVTVAAAAGGLVLVLPLAGEALLATSVPIAPALFALLAAAGLGGSYLLTDRYEKRARTDADTGLPNYRALLAEGARTGAGDVVAARIEGFPAIAAALGPALTAKLVGRVADRLRYVEGDTPVFRTDDASLAWLAAQGVEGLEARLDSIAAVMSAPVDCGRLVDVSLTFGFAEGRHEELKHSLANAALAASRAARLGVRWLRFTDEEGASAERQVALLAELDTAMATGQLWNAYQPKLDLASGRVIGCEALVRWQHPQRGPIPPDAFIPIVEEHGRVRNLTVYVLEQALEDARSWADAGYPLGVAVNVSATLLADHGFIELVGQILQRSDVPKGRLTIEVTETAAMDSPERAIAALESWRRLGVNISIDDYGTGQSSLGYLQKMPASELKIDKSFVQTVGTDERNAIMVRSTIEMAHQLGMKVVAEGIEDEACLRALREMGCDTAQGYWISRPISADAVVPFLEGRAGSAKAA
jgi:diguanylate cyclase